MEIKTIHEPKFYKALLEVTRTYTVIVPGRTTKEAERNALGLELIAFEDLSYEEDRHVSKVKEV